MAINNAFIESGLRDTFARKIDYLRLSLIEQCNFRCFYCQPEKVQVTRQSQCLSAAEIKRLASLFIDLGVRKIRLTGGEPLLRHDLVSIVQSLGSLVDLQELTLSTNGQRLKVLAESLKDGGVNRVNISLDTLQRDRFQRITGLDLLHEVMQGIEAALKVGLTPIKINMVVLAGVNDDEIVPMLRFAKQRGLDLRFIESMPIGAAGQKAMQHFIAADQILDRIQQSTQSELIPLAGMRGAGPARYYRLGQYGATVGVISAVSRHFCHSCNRVRLSARGDLLPCLGEVGSISLAQRMRAGADDQQLQDAICEGIANKPWSHPFADGSAAGDRPMSQIGG